MERRRAAYLPGEQDTGLKRRSGLFLAAQQLWMNEQARAGRDVYAYFNNHAGAHAVRNARMLRRLTAAEADLRQG